MIEKVVVKTQKPKLCQLADLHRYFSFETVVAQVQESKLGEVTNGWWNFPIEIVVVEVENRYNIKERSEVELVEYSLLNRIKYKI
ncbi:hypothetical protein TIFTF001_052442 [Ficus carica]|uniref:Uncharacterized protein n=1 Tax=Ficus carica TaxID=3494 RepID=A0AA88JJ54_FICCA|nr:hypothetical protein TIFTF001_052439 [Ficus carica]GMN74740.1 hypothetical protein TIFTF001_052440 [Ficus carica]GMN74743.1 hypothetical protein TIFTF001_052441 [Ficus carica]GMN74746.1 hypothetical protein TIFTF001_052442 [Ficus carica]